MQPTDADEVMADTAVADNVGRTSVAPPDLDMVGERTAVESDHGGIEGMLGKGGGAGRCEERRESLRQPTDGMRSELPGSGGKEEPQVGVTAEPMSSMEKEAILSRFSDTAVAEAV